jgi:hypothetical protein
MREVFFLSGETDGFKEISVPLVAKFQAALQKR